MFEEDYNFNDSITFQHINLKKHVQPSFPHLSQLKRKNQEKFSKQKLNSFIDIDRQAQAIQLINVDPNSLQLQLKDQAVELLKTYSVHNLAFISIIGMKSSGKSFLIDKILNLAGVKGNHFNKHKNPGIYVFNNPFILENQTRVFFLELVHSQAIGAGAQNKIKAELKALSTVCMLISSSVLILQNVHKAYTSFSFSQMMQVIQKNLGRVIFENKPVYKNSRILPSSGWYLYRNPNEVFNESNNIFNMKTFLLPDAMNPLYKGNKQDLATVSYLCKDVVNQNYIIKVSELFKSLSKQTRQKKQNGLVYNGNIVLKIIQHLIKKINQDKVIQWEFMFKQLLEELYQSAYQYCIIIYDDFLQKQLSDEKQKNIDQLLTIFQNASQNVLLRYNQYSLDSTFHQLYEEKLLQYMATQEQNVIMVNNEKSKLKYTRLADTTNLLDYKDIQKKLFEIRQNGVKNRGAAVGIGILLEEYYNNISKGINTVDQAQIMKLSQMQQRKVKLNNKLQDLKKISVEKKKQYSELQNQMTHLENQCKQRDKEIAHLKHEIQCAKKIDSQKEIGGAQRLIEELKKEIKNNEENLKKLKAENIDSILKELVDPKIKEIEKIKQQQVVIEKQLKQIQGNDKKVKKTQPLPVVQKPKPEKKGKTAGEQPKQKKKDDVKPNESKLKNSKK